MTGSLQVKNGKYYMVLNSTENGKRKQKWISTGLPEKGNKRKAEQMLREKLTEEEYALGIAKDSDLLEVANEVIAKLKEEGKIDEFVLNHNMQQ